MSSAADPSNEKKNKNQDDKSKLSKESVNNKPMKYFGGIEGGATKTNMVIIDCDRNILAEGEVGASNPWLIGFEKSAKLILQLVSETKSRVSDSIKDIKLEAIGMSLSGAGQEESKTQLREALKVQGAEIDTIFIEEDILAPVFALSSKGGVNMICGTGSNCVVYNDDGTFKRVGGWGHLLGDEAGGYWIAQRAIKTLFDHFDNFRPIKLDTEKMRQALFKYMKISSMDEILEYFYKSFSKDHIAGFAKEISKLADKGDKLAQDIFRQAGEELGRHILAIQPSIKPSMLDDSGSLSIICTGSVFNGWKHLKPGLEAIISNSKTMKTPRLKLAKLISKENFSSISTLSLNKSVKELSFVKLTTPAAIGAAVWAASKIKVPVKEPKKTEICKLIDTLTYE